jgi:hypothetical protein
MTSRGVDDRELWSVLVALQPLDDRKWRSLELIRRTFETDAMLNEPWSSGERVLVEVAASLWNTGRVDLGYIACALGDRHLQAVIDAVAVRAGREVRSDVTQAVARVATRPPTGIASRHREPAAESRSRARGLDR